MDYKGQERAERVFQVLITICAVVGFLLGYKEQKFSYTVFCTLGGFFVSLIIMLFPLPCYRVRKDLVWQKVLEEKSEGSEDGAETDSKQKKKK